MRRFRALAAIAVGLTLLAGSAAAQMSTEVIPLGYRSAAELVPILEPLVPAPGTVTGLYTNLIVRSTPENLEEVKRVLAELDRAPANLLISVRHGLSNRAHRSRGEAFAVIEEDGLAASAGPGGVRGTSERTRAGVRVYDTRSATEGRDVQQVRVLEGHRAFIRFGESVPLAERSIIVFGGGVSIQDSITYRDVTSGFYVRPRLSGDTAMLEISPHRSELSGAGGGAIDVVEASTVVSAPLGRWVPLAGSSNQAAEDEGAVLYSTRSYEADTRTLYVKVERLD